MKFFSTFLLCAFCFAHQNYAQDAMPKNGHTSKHFLNKMEQHDVFNQRDFISNIGQYDHLVPDDMGTVYFGFEQFTGFVSFTSKGLSYDVIKKVEEEEDNEEEEPESEKHYKRERHSYQVYFEGANPDIIPQPVGEALSYHYTYWKMTGKAKAYKGIKYANLYNGIDLIYSIPDKEDKEHPVGFEYGFVIHPGADPAQIKMRYAGDFERIYVNQQQEIIIETESGNVKETSPIAYTQEFGNRHKPLVVSYLLEGNMLRFNISGAYDRDKTLVIDPYVVPLTAFSQTNCGFNVDYDYSGNLYVYGGGDFSSSGGNQEVAKYSSTGSLLWVFQGTIPGWNSSGSLFCFGDMGLDKANEKVYIGQGYNSGGAIAIRLNGADGVYDGYSSQYANGFVEIWDILIVCDNNNGSNIYLAGGSNVSGLNFGVADPVTGSVSAQNLSGYTFQYGQDIVNSVVDPSDGTLYSCFACASFSSINNHILKSPKPYSNTNIGWIVPTGFLTLTEYANKAFIQNGNGANILAINRNYLYYYDGYNLEAIDKSTGNVVRATIVPSNMPLAQGGIAVDGCDNIYIGMSGSIKVYHFNGTSFDDTPADIPLGINTPIFDIRLDEPNNLLYVTGSNIIGVYSTNQVCAPANSPLQFQVLTCSPSYGDVSVTTTSTPTGATLTYIITDTSGNIIQQSVAGMNQQFVFHNISSGDYTVEVRADANCNGARAIQTISVNCCILSASASITPNPAVFCSGDSVLISAVNPTGTAPFTYSWSSPSGHRYSSSSIMANRGGLYSLTVTDQNLCSSSVTIAVIENYSPVLSPWIGAPYQSRDTIYAGQSISISALDTVHTGVMYHWTSTPDMNLSNVSAGALSVTPSDTASYVFHIQATLNNCVTNTELWLFVKPNKLVVPNSFSPNGDGVNDVFRPIWIQEDAVQVKSFKVYDRWGKVIFDGSSRSGWDGTYQGEPLPSDTYIYYIIYKKPEDMTDTLKAGDVTLLR